MADELGDVLVQAGFLYEVWARVRTADAGIFNA